MKNLNREAIKRMTESSGGSVGGGGGSEPISMAGYATQIWTEQNFISKEFFNRVFTILDANGNAIEPNDTDTAIDKLSLPSKMSVTGDTSVGGKMEVAGTSKLTGNVGIGTNPHSTYALNANGEVLVQTGVLSNGYVTALSDIRKKNVIEDVELDIDAIALARLIRFTWKDRKFDKGEHVGGIAQEWQKIIPEAVHESADGTLSMDYGTIGMMSAVTLARKVVEQERRLEELEARIKRLENIL
jgi:hypothetical protein